MPKLTREQIAWRAARDIQEGAVVNLGIGMPVAVSNHLPADRDVFFQSENGVVGVGPAALNGQGDPDLVDAGSRQITLRAGATIIDSAASFAMIRGGHIDITVLGAFEVNPAGDLANWDARVPDKGALVGGAMDLAACAKETWVLMAHTTRSGAPRLREALSLPLTAAACVTRIYTDLAVVEITPQGFVVTDRIADIDDDEFARLTGASFEMAPAWRVLDGPNV
jgi:3-oxoadipate CoA-transferase beta subunit